MSDQPRGYNSWCWSKGAQPLGTRQAMMTTRNPRLFYTRVFPPPRDVDHVQYLRNFAILTCMDNWLPVLLYNFLLKPKCNVYKIMFDVRWLTDTESQISHIFHGLPFCQSLSRQASCKTSCMKMSLIHMQMIIHSGETYCHTCVWTVSHGDLF